jgi:SPP1 gp7 family putative phage head morphogenesis protein
VISQQSSPTKLPFKESVDFFRKKQVLPTKGYRDVEREMHDRAFMVAGCEKQEVLLALQAAVDKAIAEGQTLRNFQKDFEKIIADRWDPKGGSAWRARVIWETNMRTSYAAGRYKQLSDMKDTHPFWQYRHGDSIKPRPEHMALDGVVLRADDPWWDRNCPPNGWGCQCYVRGLTEGQVQRGGYKVASGGSLPDAAADPHWQYAPGKQEAIWPAASPKGERPGDAFGGPFKPLEHPLDNQTWESLGRPEVLESRHAEGKILEGGTGNPAEALREILKGEQKMVSVECGDWKLPLVIDAQGLGGHLKADRIPFLGLLDDALKPQEIWAQFMKNDAGKVVLRYKMLTSVEVRGKKLLLICEGNSKGVLDAFNFFPVSKNTGINNARIGRLVAWAK